MKTPGTAVQIGEVRFVLDCSTQVGKPTGHWMSTLVPESEIANCGRLVCALVVTDNVKPVGLKFGWSHNPPPRSRPLMEAKVLVDDGYVSTWKVSVRFGRKPLRVLAANVPASVSGFANLICQ